MGSENKSAQAQSLENFTFKLTQSSDDFQLWTTLPADKIFKDDPIPEAIGSQIKVYAAKNEFEPFLIAVRPTNSGTVSVHLGDFGSGITAELYQVKYVHIATPTDYFGRVGDNPDPLWPIANGAQVDLTARENNSFWINVAITKDTPAGEYSTLLTIGTVSIPVLLHVFDFTIPDELHVKSQMNFSHSTVLDKYGVNGTGAEYWLYLDKMKQFFIDHRLTPKNPLWSGGLTSNGGGPYIDYDCNGTIEDNDGVWGFEEPAARYLEGNGRMGGRYTADFNDGTGFPSFMAATFQNNDASADQRPSSFCGQPRSAADWYTADNPATPYNQRWFTYIAALRDYLAQLDYLDQAYYYFANEPQDQVDYDAVAWYAEQLKQVAPDLKLMVSEEPKPQIFNHPNYSSAKIDIWMAHLGVHFDPLVSWDRLANFDEETWIYFLHGTRLPRFNPITIDHPGIEGRLTGWFLWKYRLGGIGYYQFNNWSSNPWVNTMDYGQNGNRFLIYPPSQANSRITYGANDHRFVPSIRLEMIRDGFEDYEYLYLLNNGSIPQPYEVTAADPHVDKVIGDTVAYSRNSSFIYNLRKLIGQKLGGEITAIPDLAPPSDHPRSDGVPGNYYINFQDPTGEPLDNPLIIDGNTYIKIGDALYDPVVGYGWVKAAEVPDSDFYPHWDQWIDAEPKKLLGSSVIDSWGRHDVFEFDLPNGTYSVTAAAGSRSNPRYQNIVIEGQIFMDDEETRNSWITRTREVTVRDKKLTMVMGKYERIGYINYLQIEAVEKPGDANCDGAADLRDVLVMLRVISGQSSSLGNCTPTPGDMNGDFRVGVGDSISLLKQLSE